LLYTGQEKEYKQAKQRAADTLGVRMLPSNRDVAAQLDKIADEMEGSSRREKLVQMRRDALSVMVTLGDFSPRLVGSVWRGTAHINSDIDIEVFCSDHRTVLQRLERNGFTVGKAMWQAVTKGTRAESAFHIYTGTGSEHEVELVVRSPEKMNETDTCETYGDIIKGLNTHQLRNILLTHPTQKFVPVSSTRSCRENMNCFVEQ